MKKNSHSTCAPGKRNPSKFSLSPDNEIAFPGTFRAYKRADLSFRVDGIVIVRDIKVGHVAKKGEVLFQLDPHAYEINLKKAQGKVESINQHRGELTIAEADVNGAADDLSYTTLKAPFDGIISAIYIENHEQVRLSNLS